MHIFVNIRATKTLSINLLTRQSPTMSPRFDTVSYKDRVLKLGHWEVAGS